jgi:hypothetical protein
MAQAFTDSTTSPDGLRRGKRYRAEISLIILVPFILGGLAALPLLAVENIWPELFTGHRVVMLCLLSGGTVYRRPRGFYLGPRPIRRFLDTNRDMAVLPPAGPARRGGAARAHLEGGFDQIVEGLSAMDARALFPDMVGESRALRAMFSQLLKVAPTEATVLLLGESGTGKELAARSLHGKAPGPEARSWLCNCAGPFPRGCGKRAVRP